MECVKIVSKLETNSNNSSAKAGEQKSGVVTSFRKTRKSNDDTTPIAAEKLAELKAQLAKLEEHIEHLPDVDATRVVELHNRIEAGKYDIDAYRIAEKLAELESDLNRE